MEDEQLAEEVVEAAPAGNEEIVEQPAIAVPAVEDPDGLNGLLQPNAVQEAPHRVAEIGELEFHEVVRDANAMIAEQLAWLERGANRIREGNIQPGLGDMERAAVRLIGELRNMVDRLVRERDNIRHLVVRRGLLDEHPFFDRLDELVNVWAAEEPREVDMKSKNPKTLENKIVQYVAKIIRSVPAEAALLPTPLLFKLYVNLYVEKKMDVLSDEWHHIDRFHRILEWKMRRLTVHKIFNELVSKSHITEQDLFQELKSRMLDRTVPKDMALYDCALNTGYLVELVSKLLAAFFLERGSFVMPGEILGYCQKILNKVFTDYEWRQRKLFELNYWLLKYYVSNCSFVEATNVSSFTDVLIDRLVSSGINSSVDFALIQAQTASLWYLIGDYNSALKFCLKALDVAKNRDTQIAGQVEVLCITAKVLVFKKHFALALKAVRFALALVLSHPDLEERLCSVLCDYGDCLLNSDCVELAMKVYTVMFNLVDRYFGQSSLREAQAMCEYARAALVFLYDSYGRHRSNGVQYAQIRFRCQRYTYKAIEIYKTKLDEEHYQRLNAEQLEGQQLTEGVLLGQNSLLRLNKVVKINMKALKKYQSVMPENVHCAKTYDNLGRVFQALEKPDVSEQMLEKALTIKRRIYGDNEHETALTMARLADLFIKYLNRPREALILFEKCLEIEISIFGEEYSGLGFIYNGMALAYDSLDDVQEAQRYREKLYAWKTARSDHEARQPMNPFGKVLMIKSTFQEIVCECHAALLPFRDMQQNSEEMLTRATV